MLKKLLPKFICTASVLVLLSSCGDADVGGGVGEFTTVTASASVATPRLESDVVTGNTCSDTGSTGGTVSTDTVDVVVSSRALFPTGNLNLLISKITVHYEPTRAGTPRLPDYFIATNQSIAPGGTLTVPVPVVPEALKIDLMSDPNLSNNLGLCSGQIFEYYVTVTFEMSEPGGNGKVQNVPASLNVAVADRAA